MWQLCFRARFGNFRGHEMIYGICGRLFVVFGAAASEPIMTITIITVMIVIIMIVIIVIVSVIVRVTIVIVIIVIIVIVLVLWQL